jgi:hypothetical protein
MGGDCSTHERYKIYTQTSVDKPEGKEQRVRPRRRWKDNIRISLAEVERECVKGTLLTEGRVQWRTVVNTVMNLQIP